MRMHALSEKKIKINVIAHKLIHMDLHTHLKATELLTCHFKSQVLLFCGVCANPYELFMILSYKFCYFGVCMQNFVN